MRKRLGEFGLSLHPQKTRLIEFGRDAAERRKQRGLGKPETFNFLGFTFICGKTRAGKFQIKRKTRRDRMRAKLRKIKQDMRRRMHQPIPEQGGGCGRWSEATSTITRCRQLRALVRSELDRQTLVSGAHPAQRGTKLNWERMKRLIATGCRNHIFFIPGPISASPSAPRSEPYAGKLHGRICAGALSNERPYRDHSNRTILLHCM